MTFILLILTSKIQAKKIFIYDEVFYDICDIMTRDKRVMKSNPVLINTPSDWIFSERIPRDACKNSGIFATTFFSL